MVEALNGNVHAKMGYVHDEAFISMTTGTTPIYLIIYASRSKLQFYITLQFLFTKLSEYQRTK